MSGVDLATVDRLWIVYSQGRFGFSVQWRLLQSAGLEALSNYKEQLMARTDSGAKQGRSNRKLDRNGVTSPNYMPLLGCTLCVTGKAPAECASGL